jgi:hypothetical protein
VATAGGYWRDALFGKTAKDIDFFLLAEQGQYTLSQYQDIAKALVKGVGLDVFSIRTLPCYGEWADDIVMLCKVSVDNGPDVDVVFLNASIYGASTFMEDCLNRFDVRLNSIGADVNGWSCNKNLVSDLEEQRLVVHWERLPMCDRMHRRMEYLTGENKFPGWTCWVESDNSGDRIEPYTCD